MINNVVARCCYLELVLKLEEDDEHPPLELQNKIKKDDDKQCDYLLSSFRSWKTTRMMMNNNAPHRCYWVPSLELEKDNKLVLVVLLHNCKK